MPLQSHQSGLLGPGQKRGIPGRVRQRKGYVHAGTAGRVDRAPVETGCIDGTVQEVRLALVDLAHGLQPALLLEPLEHQPGQIPGVGGRRVVHGAGIRVDLVVEHRGRPGKDLPHQVLSHDHHGETGGSDVLLRTRVDHAVARDVDGTRQDHRGHIGHQRHIAGVGNPVKFHAADGLIRRVVDVCGIRIQVPLLPGRNRGEAGRLRARGKVYVAEALGLCNRLLGPRARVDVVGLLAAAQQIHGHHGELGACSALEEKHLVVGGDVHELTQVRLRLFRNLHERLAAMTHLHHGHSRTLPVEHLLPSLLQHRLGQHRGTGTKVEYAPHNAPPDRSLLSTMCISRKSPNQGSSAAQQAD